MATVNELMTHDPRTVGAATSVAEAARLMRDDDVGSLPVVEGDRLVGTVTDRDIVVRVVADGRGGDTTVGEIASREVVTIDPQQDADEAMRLMAEHQVRRLPVCEEDGRLVGIVAQADVARHGADARTGETVERISR
ncbi:MAG TPA: CBS domain-containing protein [Gaiellaceae bacterium]|nr:CBS domain-containing protein [Gaiellaceae bacterium]